MEQTILRKKNNESIPEIFTGIVEWWDGAKKWYKEGKLHRLDGPAVEYSNGRKYWYKEGKRHREDGPAIEYSNGTREWWIYDIEYTLYYFNLLYKNSIYLGKERGRYNLEWLKFLTENEIQEFPIIPGMKEYKDFKMGFEELERIESK
jgi:hypothetical protein